MLSFLSMREQAIALLSLLFIFCTLHVLTVSSAVFDSVLKYIPAFANDNACVNGTANEQPFQFALTGMYATTTDTLSSPSLGDNTRRATQPPNSKAALLQVPVVSDQRNDVGDHGIVVPTAMASQQQHHWVDGDHLRITYQLVQGHRFSYNDMANATIHYACRNATTWDAIDNRKELPSSNTTNKNNPFDFQFVFQTSLNMLIMGDSLAVQFGSWLQVAGGGRANRTILQMLDWKKDGFVEGLTVATVNGGGKVAYWRLMNFWRPDGVRLPVRNRGKGWRKTWVRHIQGMLPSASDKYDVVVFRISHPWIPIHRVTVEALSDTIQTARAHLGQPLIFIFQTAPFENNVVTEEDWIQFRAMNNLVRSFVTDLNASDVLLSDVATYMENVMEWNAKQLGIIPNDTTTTTATTTKNTSTSSSYVLERLGVPPPHLGSAPRFRTHVAQVCSERPPPSHNYTCRLNMLSNDGMHPCMESLGPRMFANTACLIQCAYYDRKSESPSSGGSTGTDVRECERGCNEQFFRLDQLLPGVFNSTNNEMPII